MSIEVQALASGSSGNSILVRNGRTALLIDAGIGIKRLSATLLGLQIDPTDLSAILITHEHSDHTIGAVRMANRYGIPLVANAKTLDAISGAARVANQILDPGVEQSVGSLAVRSFPISHDAAQPCGFTIEGGGARICNVTDTGVLSDTIREEAIAADLLILESNHDVKMLERGPYPPHLKKRILGIRGHLSNDAASGLLRDLAASGSKMSVWLAHLSHMNNTPSAALSCAKRLLSECEGHGLSVEVAKRDVPSLNWRHGRGIFQLSLFGPRRDNG